jgi:hypothetical protein
MPIKPANPGSNQATIDRPSPMANPKALIQAMPGGLFSQQST